MAPCRDGPLVEPVAVLADSKILRVCVLPHAGHVVAELERVLVDEGLAPGGQVARGHAVLLDLAQLRPDQGVEVVHLLRPVLDLAVVGRFGP